jgi:hypothetical protein
MAQNQRGDYRKHETLFGEFRHSCLGRLIITCGILGILALIAWITNPSEQTMRQEMDDNIRQWIQENDSLNNDWIDDAVLNTGFIFTAADSVNTPEQEKLLEQFDKHNRLEYFNHDLFSTMHIYNSFHIEGKRCGIGFFGIVIPTVNFNDFLLREGPMRKDYNQPIIRNTGEEEYFGENPDLGGVFRYNGE